MSQFRYHRVCAPMICWCCLRCALCCVVTLRWGYTADISCFWDRFPRMSLYGASKCNIFSIAVKGATERVFNVAPWKWRKKPYVFKALRRGKSTGNGRGCVDEEKQNAAAAVDMNKMEFLDAHIDEVHAMLAEGNIVIHCLAGAHRSPFITGCFLLKYGLAKEEDTSPAAIYKHMKGKRSIVQELGYDKELMEYQEYLLAKEKESA